MNTVSVAINLPTDTTSPEAFQAAIHQAISTQTMAGNNIAAVALGNLLSMMRGFVQTVYSEPYDWRKDPMKNGGNGY